MGGLHKAQGFDNQTGLIIGSPWGIVEAPWDFGSASGTILIGNFGDGTINSFDSENGTPKGTLMSKAGGDSMVFGRLRLVAF